MLKQASTFFIVFGCLLVFAGYVSGALLFLILLHSGGPEAVTLAMILLFPLAVLSSVLLLGGVIEFTVGVIGLSSANNHNGRTALLVCGVVNVLLAVVCLVLVGAFGLGAGFHLPVFDAYAILVDRVSPMIICTAVIVLLVSVPYFIGALREA